MLWVFVLVDILRFFTDHHNDAYVVPVVGPGRPPGLGLFGSPRHRGGTDRIQNVDLLMIASFRLSIPYFTMNDLSLLQRNNRGKILSTECCMEYVQISNLLNKLCTLDQRKRLDRSDMFTYKLQFLF